MASKNRDKRLKALRAYYYRHRDLILLDPKRKQKCKEWRDKNKEKNSMRSKKWYRENRTRKLEVARKWAANNRAHLRELSRKYSSSSFRSMLSAKLRSAKRHDTIKNRPFDIDLDYVLAILSKQDGLCAITGIKLNHQFKSLYSVSIDRIDSTKGHVRGNIQILSLFAQFAKMERSNSETIQIVKEIGEIAIEKWAKKAGT